MRIVKEIKNYIIIDIETCLDLKEYFDLPTNEQKKKMNPIDSKIVAIGLTQFKKYNSTRYK